MSDEYDEVEAISADRPDARPPGSCGRTWLVRPAHGDPPTALLARIRAAWTVVARWGHWCDEDRGEWPSADACLADLPDWLAFPLSSRPDLENWLADLHDREWLWWSGHAADDLVKIDVATLAEPSSTWPLEHVIESAGGRIIRRGDWVALGDYGLKS